MSKKIQPKTTTKSKTVVTENNGVLTKTVITEEKIVLPRYDVKDLHDKLSVIITNAPRGDILGYLKTELNRSKDKITGLLNGRYKSVNYQYAKDIDDLYRKVQNANRKYSKENNLPYFASIPLRMNKHKQNGVYYPVATIYNPDMLTEKMLKQYVNTLYKSGVTYTVSFRFIVAVKDYIMATSGATLSPDSETVKEMTEYMREKNGGGEYMYVHTESVDMDSVFSFYDVWRQLISRRDKILSYSNDYIFDAITVRLKD